jgi:ribonuclease HI
MRACERCAANGGKGALVAYTDGSMSKEEEAVAGWGVVIVQRSGSGSHTHENKNEGTTIEEMWGQVALERKSKFYLGMQKSTNNTGELTALIETLLWFREYNES